MQHIAADVVAFDRILAHYGEGAREARTVLRSVLANEFGRLSASGRLCGTDLALPVQDARILGFYDRLQALSP